MVNNWVNYGDANPFPHGGFWIKEEEGFAGQYRYVELSFVDDDMEFEINSGLVDLTDDWIDWSDVSSTCDITEETIPERKVQSLVWYYGHANFGSYGPDEVIKYHDNVEDEVAKGLEKYGITI